MKFQALFAIIVASAACFPSALAFKFFVTVDIPSGNRMACLYASPGDTFVNDGSNGPKCVSAVVLTSFEADPGHSLSNPDFTYPHAKLYFVMPQYRPVLVYTAEFDYLCGPYATDTERRINIYVCNRVEPARLTITMTTTTSTTTITTTTTTTSTTTTTTTTTSTITTPITTPTTTPVTTPTTTLTTTLPANATCIGNSKGKKKGDGYKDYCCLSHLDCFNSCIKGKCDGPAFPSSTATISLPVGCTKGLEGKKNGKGTNGYCCYSDADCVDSCINGKCSKAKVTLEPTTTSTPSPPSSTCTPGSKGKKKGNGLKNYCCSSSADCRDSCIKGKCN